MTEKDSSSSPEIKAGSLSTSADDEQFQQPKKDVAEFNGSSSSSSGSNDSNVCSNEFSTPRSMVGKGVVFFTDMVNENIVTFRYGMVATIAVTTAYALAHTPLFFRFKTVADIPASYFVRRKRIRGRIIKVIETDTIKNGSGGNSENQTIICMIRHLSPMGLLLSKSWFDFFMNSRPSANMLPSSAKTSSVSRNEGPEFNPYELLQVELAGIKTPPTYYNSSSHNHIESTIELLRRLENERTLVSCQLLARRVKKTKDEESKNKMKMDMNNYQTKISSSSIAEQPPKKRNLASVLPELSNDTDVVHNKANTSSSVTDNNSYIDSSGNNGDYSNHPLDQIAVCRLYYRPSLMQLFATDIAEKLVREGQVNVSSDGLYGSSLADITREERIITDTTTRINDIQKDAKYMEKLSQVEYEACKSYNGMWMDPNVRKERSDIVEEIEFQSTAPIYKKIWRWFRGG